ncbi:MAG: peptide-methionine (S)-S-oxide reductase MsrA [Flavobacteriales bacterium]|nr:peptide-methionine (S)-S-oxide reductase MsrA [Flavobacteriales bacterium]MBK7941411.1 peptide-methionine (S)-S-oxide reductase MsrA [Flavobacteriales bacterium]MBK8949166.1 peptide-methionine (S)-S-oxide reductase MsrA [Flavobacteriales bacterium]MBK9701490.1 peptide-methionine (S)-S-oxide reductase MsrA [Flavobacteriales bacterium]
MRAPITLAFTLVCICACQGGSRSTDQHTMTTDLDPSSNATNTDTAVLGAGCFWCVEAVFTELDGVLEVTSGYTGGHVKNPGYKEVCAGTTGHAEVARIVFDPGRITFDELLEVFWQTHDPTTLNRQGADIGAQYRSAVFATSVAQRELAEAYKAKLNASGAFPAPIVTEITELTTFYPAEDHHQNYYAQNGEQGYCQLVIRPKLEKFRKVFAEKLKP